MTHLPAFPSRTDALRILDRSDGDLLASSAHQVLIIDQLKQAAPFTTSQVIDQIDDTLLAARNDACHTGWGYFAQVAIHLDALEFDAVALVLKHYELVSAGLCAGVRPRQIAVQLTWI